MMIKKYRNKPVMVEAIQFNGWNWKECMQFISDEKLVFDDALSEKKGIKVETPKGNMIIYKNDYIIKFFDDTIGYYGPNAFEKIYEEIPFDKE